jgi:hypothetical protein
MTENSPIKVTAEEAILAGKFLGQADIPAAIYHKAPALSFSGMKELAETPAHYRAYLKAEREETAAQRLGTFVHLRTLEPETFENKVCLVENRMSKENKAKIVEAEAEGRKVLTIGEYEKVCRISDAVLSDPEWKAYTKEGKAEQSIFWRDQETGVLLKCRPDWLRSDGVILDLKTFGDLNDKAIMTQISRMKYHWQSALYLEGVHDLLGMESKFFVHFFVMTDEPYLVRPIVLNDASLEKARHEFTPHIETYKHCLNVNQWPGYERPETGVTELTLADWSW